MRKRILSAIVIVTLSLAPNAMADEATPTISVSGRSEAFVVPDQIRLRFAVESRGSLSDATQDNAKRNGQVLKFLRSAGIDAKSIQTISLEIDPIMAEDRQMQRKAMQDPFGDVPQRAQVVVSDLKPKGYLVSRELSVVISPIGSFEEIYTGLLNEGVNKIDSIEFRSTQRKQTEFTTRVAAIRDAKHKAEAMAAELGATLQGVQTITDQAPRARYYGGDPFGSPSSNAVAVGQMKIEAGVSVVFRLSQTDFE